MLGLVFGQSFDAIVVPLLATQILWINLVTDWSGVSEPGIIRYATRFT